MCVLVLFSDAYYRDTGYSILMNATLFLIAASALVGNLWAMLIFNRQQKLERENALEAGKRQVELTARAAKGILAVEVKNPFEGEFSNGLPRTTKHDAQNHGYGLRSIQDIVKKYGGNMEIRQENGQFCLFLFMHSPMQREYAAKAAHGE